MSDQAASELDDTAKLQIDHPPASTAPSRPATVSWGAATSIGSVRRANEDRWIAVDDRAFAVADGMGGHDGGLVAAETAVGRFGSVVDAVLSDGDVAASIAEVNDAVATALRARQIERGGTTLAGVVLRGDVMTVVNVGDSRILRARSGGISRLTTDHTLEERRSVDVPPMEPGSGLLTGLISYVGMDALLLEVDVDRFDIWDDDVVVICSDGVHGQVPVAEMASILSARPAQLAAEELVAAADRAGGRDNATAIVVRFGDG